MNLKTITLGCALVAGLVATAAVTEAQQRADFKIRNIRRVQTEAPNYGGTGDLGGFPSTMARQWYKIEVQYESQPDWSDDVQLKVYVLLGTGRDARMFVGDVTHVDVQKGTQHYAGFFIHPNTLKRYGAGQVQAVAVQLFYQNRLQDMASDPPSQERWWEKYTPVTGFVRNPLETPWAPISAQRFEASKMPARQ
jgi:hypothetical protein